MRKQCGGVSYRSAEVAGRDAPYCGIRVRGGGAGAEAGLQTAELAAPHAQRICALPKPNLKLLDHSQRAAGGGRQHVSILALWHTGQRPHAHAWL